MAAETTSTPLPASSKYLPVDNPTKSFWHRDLHELSEHRTTAELPEQSDVVIIGAGYAGIATAYHLIRDRKPDDPKLSITVLEARFACSGATGRNGGHVRPALYDSIPNYIDRHGLDAAVEWAEYEQANLWAIKSVIKQENIDCDFILTRYMDVVCNEAGAKDAKRIYDKIAQHSPAFFRDCYFYQGPNAERISGVKQATAFLSHTSGTVWPYKLFLHLLKGLVDAGEVNLQTNTPATSIARSSSSTSGTNHYLISTPRGTTRATKVIHATNAYISGLLPQYSRSIVPCKGVCVEIQTSPTHPRPLLTNSYNVMSPTDNTSCYLHARSDGSLVAGGASRTFRRNTELWYDNVDDSVLIDSVKAYFEGFMQRTFVGWEHTDARVGQAWSGIMGYSFDSLPHVGNVVSGSDQGPDGRDKAEKNEYVIAGFNGHGMPVVWLAAKGLAKMVREDKAFEDVGLPRLAKTTKERVEKAWKSEDGGDILGRITLAMKPVPADTVKK